MVVYTIGYLIIYQEEKIVRIKDVSWDKVFDDNVVLQGNIINILKIAEQLSVA